MAALSQEEVLLRIKAKYGDKYTMLEPYKNRREKVKFRCNIHNIEFYATGETYLRSDRSFNICPLCKKEAKFSKDLNVECAYCGIKFHKSDSQIQNSKSGLHFCCREHKDLAQRLESNITQIWPNHYGKQSDYRELAFRNFEHKCCVCGWNEDKRILEVHHKDSNRENNLLKNLCILCPNCHRKITLGYYILTEDYTLIKV